MANGYDYKISKGKDFHMDVEVTLTPERYQAFEDTVYNRLAQDVKLPGFRNGKAPKAQVMAKLGTKLITETVKELLPVIASEIVDAEKLSPITTLEYDVKEMKADGSVVFTFNFTNYPEIKLGDFKKLKAAKTEAEVTDQDIQEVMQRLFKQPHDHKHDHDHDHEHEHEEETKPVEVSDEMAKGLGIEDIENVADLQKRIREQLKTMKQNEAEAELDRDLLSQAIKLSDIPLPDKLIDQQTAYLVDDYVTRIQQLGVDIDGFLKAQGTDLDKIRAQKREQAKDKLSQELLMNELVKKYELTPEAADIEKEIASISDPEIRHSYDNYQGRRYVLSVLIQRRASEKLRELAGIKQ